MKPLVIAKNYKYFWNHIEDRIKADQIFKASKSQGKVILTNGDEFIFVSSHRSMRGYHGVNVVMWSVPDWFDSDETEMLARMARMP